MYGEISKSQRDAVGETYPAVEETYPAVDTFSHGIYFLRGGGSSEGEGVQKNAHCVKCVLHGIYFLRGGGGEKRGAT